MIFPYFCFTISGANVCDKITAERKSVPISRSNDLQSVFPNFTLTKEEAVDEHRRMWKWIAELPERQV